MSTLAQGDKFEERVFDALSDELKDDRLGLSPATARLFRKKGYFSRDRKTNIVVDISIEVWPPAAENYSLLWACECKDYGHSVPVDDIEEFKAKLDQIAGKNLKAVFATSNSLQRGALSYARSNGIGVVRILPDNQVNWVLYSSKDRTRYRSKEDDYIFALTREDHVGRNQAFYGVFDGDCMDCWHQLLHENLKHD